MKIGQLKKEGTVTLGREDEVMHNRAKQCPDRHALSGIFCVRNGVRIVKEVVVMQSKHIRRIAFGALIHLVGTDCAWRLTLLQSHGGTL